MGGGGEREKKGENKKVWVRKLKERKGKIQKSKKKKAKIKKEEKKEGAEETKRKKGKKTQFRGSVSIYSKKRKFE